MYDSGRTLLRKGPIQKVSSTSAEAEITQAIEKYARTIFQDLLRIEHSNKDWSQVRKRHINSFSFWQYSKLPKLISDRLFEAVAEQKRWSCPDLIEWISLEIRGSLKDQLKTVFRMLDGNRDGLVSREECVTVLSHAIANPINKSYEQCKQEKSKIQELIDQFYTAKEIEQFNFEQFVNWYSQGKWELHDTIWDCITEKINSKEKILNWMQLHQLTSRQVDSESNQQQLPTLTRSKSNYEQVKKEAPKIVYEGKMYTMTDKGLRSGYYKIINTELFQFKKNQDRKYNGVTYLGHGASVAPFTPRLETTSNQKLYGLDLVSGVKKYKFYILYYSHYLNWKNAFEEVTGCKGGILDDYNFLEDLGKGKFSFVKSAINKKTGQKVAIKVLQKNQMDHFQSQLVKEEINVQRMCKHKNLLQILDVYEDIDNVYLVLELMNGKSLMDYIQEKSELGTRIGNSEMLCILFQLAQALQYLKSFNIVHRDVKASNVLLSGKLIDFIMNGISVRAPQVKLCDFSVSTIITNEVTSQFCGTLSHVAPEIVEGLKYSFQVDMYSLGALIYQCMTGSAPFFHPNLDKLKDQIKYAQPQKMEDLRLTLPPLIYSLIQNLLRKRASDRLTILQLLSLSQIQAIQSS